MMLNDRLDDLYAQLTNPVDYTRRITREYIADWINYAKNENNEPIVAYDWLIDLLFIICDIHKQRVFLTGAAQIAKTLCSVLSTKLLTEHYNKLRIIWIYASREQGDTYPDIQIQPVFKGTRVGRTIRGDRSSRIYIRHANTSVETPSMVGKSLVKSGLSSLTADVAVCDEVSQWRTAVDPSDRVKRSVFESQPIRYYGTPGSGKGIEAAINETNATKISCYATCAKCGSLQQADLYDIISHNTEVNGRPFNYSFNQCACGASKKHLTNWRYFDDDVASCALWLHPFLHCRSPEAMDKQLSLISTRSLTDQSVANVYQQLLGTINKAGNQAITASELVYRDPPLYPPIARYYGIDQGRKELYLTELLDYGDKLYVNYLNATTLIGARDYILQAEGNSFTVTDFAPDAEAALWLKEHIPNLACAVQNNSPTSNYDYKLDTAYSNGLPYQVIKFNYVRWVEALINQFKEETLFMVKGSNISELSARHLTSVRCVSGRVIRPPDKTDDLFFSMMFAMFARTLYGVYNGNEQLKVREWR